jgi:probable O-glycosylation ligase (exosortase A-associated)
MRDIVLALFIFGTIPFILSRPYIGLLVWSWLGYMNPNRLTYGFANNFPWVMLVAIVTLFALVFSRERKRISLSSVSVLLFVFVVWTGLTTVFAAQPSAAWPKYEEFTKILVMVFVTLMLVKTRERMHGLVWVIVFSLGFYGVKGGVFTALGGGVNHVMGPAGSFITDNNALALALAMTIPLMRYLQLQSTKKWIRRGLAAAMLFTGIAVLGTYSRGGLIGLLIVAGALFVKSRQRFAVVLVIIVVGLIAWNFMPAQWTERMGTLHNASQTDSGETRIQSWKFATAVAIHHPVFAGGFEVYQDTALWRNFGPEGAIPRAIHSIYFRMLGEQGFIGLGLFLALLVASWRNCARVRKLARDDSRLRWAFDLASMLQVTLVAYMTAGAFLPMPYFDLSWQLMALTALLSDSVTQEVGERKPEERPSLSVQARRTATTTFRG